MNLPRAPRARRLRLRTTSIAVGVALAAGPVPFLAAAPASAAAAKPAKHYDDFNGDGYRDLAVSHTHDGIFAFNDRAVLVTYGGPKGLTTKKQVIHQNSPGIPGASESGDDFGTVLASADLNRDGYADLVVGNPTEEAGRTRVGSVTLVWGSAKGLKGGTALPRKATNGYGTFGADIATGDFNGDGRPDIATVNGGDVFLYRGGFTKSGGLGKVSKYDREGQSWDGDTIAAGKVNGDGKTDLIVMGVRGVGMTFRTEAWFLKGSTSGLVSGPAKVVDGKKQHERLDAAVGDFDRDGYGDIAVGNPVANDGRGRVTVWYGTSAGPGKRSITLSQSTAGVAGASEAWDQFGSSLTAGDADGDGYADLAVGVPGERVGAKVNAGGAYLFRGGKGGLKGSRSAALGKSLPGVAGETTDHDFLGYDLRLRDLNRDGRADLAISVPGEDSMRILPGAKGGVTGTGSSVLRAVGSDLPE
ncbi:MULTISPECIES: FG-GAP and VCBS repeat-containing protein [Streptomyces]|uniref:FG-GAP and VCBS repeat-containing protein n=1 Tax=Streptomyces TaxID=1883 RepID=UPI001929CD3A|nr:MULTISPECIES: FG-GAP and VCBS repeat-containing protein [unclassified Streptomyces]CAD5951489.1 FG-GAP repeat protein [Streptomyces sp. KY75]CAD5983942.1 FG-GAP repeat protein [Streptomyces sp. KY70]